MSIFWRKKNCIYLFSVFFGEKKKLHLFIQWTVMTCQTVGTIFYKLLGRGEDELKEVQRVGVESHLECMLL